MGKHDYFILAPTLHVIGMAFWIGGVAFVMTVLIPSLKQITNADDRLELFEQFEGQFAFQAKIAALV